MPKVRMMKGMHGYSAVGKKGRRPRAGAMMASPRMKRMRSKAPYGMTKPSPGMFGSTDFPTWAFAHGVYEAKSGVLGPNPTETQAPKGLHPIQIKGRRPFAAGGH